MKLGELLVREGLITPSELEEALKCQVIFGGRLGTNLIELGLIEEEEIAKTLSRKLGLPWVNPPEMLMDIPAGVLAAVSAALADRYKVIPMRLENRRLTLAMLNPSDLRAVEEIAFCTGFIVRPVVAPEIRLLLALEKHYQIARKMRYIPIARTVPNRRGAKAPPPPPMPSPFEGYLSGEEEPSAAALGISIEPEPEISEAPPRVEGLRGKEALLQGLAEVRSRDEVANLLVGHLGAEYRRVALFLLREGAVFGWKGMSAGRAIDGFDQVRIPLSEAAALKTVAESGGYHLGPVPPGANTALLQSLGGEVPEVALLLPLLLAGRIIGILYLDGGENPGERLDGLRHLASKGVMALEILILKNKILMT